jgi:uncharacterized protein YecA (UPF0149 family)
MFGFFRFKKKRMVRANSIEEAEQLFAKATTKGQEITLDLSDIGVAELDRILRSVSPKEKIGRNDACPCGSGLKYKKCCLLN